MNPESLSRLTDMIHHPEMAISVATVRADVADMLAYIQVLESRLHAASGK